MPVSWWRSGRLTCQSDRVLIATVRDKGKCPCPRCLVTFEKIPSLGDADDRACRIQTARVDDALHREVIQDARQFIHQDGYVVNSDKVEELLQPESLVPTVVSLGGLSRRGAFTHCISCAQNAFTAALHPFNFEFREILVVDLMHEYELGIWKSLFAHLVRILECIDGDMVEELNKRYGFSLETTVSLFYLSDCGGIAFARSLHSDAQRFGSSRTM